MIVLGKPTTDDLANTFSPFIERERVNRTALPRTWYRQKREKFERKYGLIYTLGAIVTGIGIFMALKQGGKIFDIKGFIQKHLQHSSAKNKEFVTKINEYPFLQKLRLRTSLLLSSTGQFFLNVGNFVGNINPFKDIAFDRITKFLMIKPLFDKLQQIFTKSAKKLSFSKYTKASKNLQNFNNSLNEAIEFLRKNPNLSFNGVKVNTDELVQKISKNIQEMTSSMSEISEKTFSSRFDRTVNLLNANTEKKFLNTVSAFKTGKEESLLGKIYSKIKETGDFLPAKIMEHHHKELFEHLFTTKQKLSNNILDLHQNLSKSVDKIFDLKCVDDDNLRHCYLKLRDLLSKFKEPSKFGVKRAEVRESLTSALNEALKQLERKGSSTEKISSLQSLINLISHDQKGIIEETVSSLKILKEVNPDLYNQLLMQRNKFQKSLSNAVTFETDKTYKKLLDFSLHSLPTDFLTIAIGAGCVAKVTANRKKTKQEKISVNLKKGIPALGAIVVSFLSNMRQVASGTGSIFLGLLSGVVLNRIGSVVNHFYMKSYGKHLAENNDDTAKTLNGIA